MAPFALAGVLLWVLRLAHGTRPSAHASSVDPAGVLPCFGVLAAVLAVLAMIAPRVARWLGAVHRGLATRLLREKIGEPAPARQRSGMPRSRLGRSRPPSTSRILPVM